MDYILLNVYDAASAETIQDASNVPAEVIAACKSGGVVNKQGVVDASETLVFARQLETIKNRIYQKKYAQLKARMHVPFSNEGFRGANGTLTYRIWDEATMAVLVSNFATDFPLVSATATELTVKYHHFGNSYGYSILELRDAARAGVPLDSKMADVARRGHELMFEHEVCFGVPQLKTFGLLNNPNVSLLSLANGTWASATGEAMLADLNQIVTNQWNGTLEIYVGDTLLMSTAAYRKIATTFVNSAGGTMTVLNAFKEQNPGITVDSWTKLNTANAAGTNGRMVFYKKDPEVMEFEIGQEFEVMPVKQDGMLLSQDCISSAAGLQIHIPAAVTYIDNQNL